MFGGSFTPMYSQGVTECLGFFCHPRKKPQMKLASGLVKSKKLDSKLVPSLKLTWHLKMDGWNTSFLLGWPIFRGELLVSGSVNHQGFGFEIFWVCRHYIRLLGIQTPVEV